MLLPDNFLYFILLFFISIFSGTYLLFSYYRNRLLTINALLFFVIGLRLSTEYYIQQVESFELVTSIATFHAILFALGYFGMRYCIWFYIRPFQNWKSEKIINAIFLWGLLIIPAMIIIGFIVQGKYFYFHTERIDGYWQFARNELFIKYPYDLYLNGLLSFMMIGVLLSSIWKIPKYRLRKSLLLVTFISFPLFYISYVDIRSEEWAIPNVASIMLVHTLIISWFVSGYRLFQTGLDSLKKDLLNSISDLSITTDLNFHINYMNQQAQALFSISNERFDEFLAMYSYQSIQQVKDKMEVLIDERTPIEASLQNEQGVLHIFAIKVAPYYVHTQHVGYTFLLTDLTDIKNKEQEIERLKTARD